MLYEPTIGARSKKLTLKWKGPYTITKVFSPQNMELISSAGPNIAKRVNVKRIKAFYSDIAGTPQKKKEIYEIEDVLAHWGNRLG